MDWNLWQERWEKTLRAVKKLGGEARRFDIASPASDKEVLIVEKNLGIVLPRSFKTVLTQFSSSVQVSWFLPKEARVYHLN